MHSSGEPQLGPGGPYHHLMPPHQMQYHAEQMPTTSHPTWHNAPGVPTPPSYHQLSQQHQQYPMTPQQPAPPIPPQQHPQMPPLTTQHQQQIQPRPTYSSPSPSRAPSAPGQNQKFRTEQWINQSWSYAQSPATPVVPSVMSYHQNNDDRMSVLSVNTAITNQYQDSQRCYSSNGSTCENVNPDLVHMNLTQAAEQAIRVWFSTPDPMQKVNMARTIREWMKQVSQIEQGKSLPNFDQGTISNYIQPMLNIIHDGLKPQPTQLPVQYYGQLFYYLIDILLRITCLRITAPFVHLVIQMFIPRENGPRDFRELYCNLIQLNFQMDPQLKPCSDKAFQILNRIIMGVNNEKMRAEFAQCLKFQRFVGTLMEYFSPAVPLSMPNPVVFLCLRFLMSKDTRLKDVLIWNGAPRDQPPPEFSVIHKLNGVMFNCYKAIMSDPNNPEVPNLNRQIVNCLELCRLLIYNSDAIDAYVKAEGFAMLCNVIQFKDSKNAGFRMLLQISDAKALAEVNLERGLPFIIRCIGDSQDDCDVLYSGTGFLSNVVAHKQHVKELAIRNNAILLLHAIISRFPKLNDLGEGLVQNRVCEIICNSLRTLNNFLMMWIPTQSSEKRPDDGLNEKQQMCMFVEQDIMKKLMICLSAEGVDSPSLMELRSTILRFFILLIRTPFIPKDNLLNVIDDSRSTNLVGHICYAFAWATRQQTTSRTQVTKQQLVERVINLLLMLMEQCGAEKQVAQYSYCIDCPLNLLNNHQMKPNFIHNVLVVCDKILEHCPTRADIWTIDRPMLEGLTNHRNPDIAKAANSLLSRFPDNDLLAGILSNSEFF